MKAELRLEPSAGRRFKSCQPDKEKSPGGTWFLTRAFFLPGSVSVTWLKTNQHEPEPTKISGMRSENLICLAQVRGVGAVSGPAWLRERNPTPERRSRRPGTDRGLRFGDRVPGPASDSSCPHLSAPNGDAARLQRFIELSDRLRERTATPACAV